MQEITVYDTENSPLSDLVQWDSDVHIRLIEDIIDKAYPVHFFNQTLNEALVVKDSSYENGRLKVKIPNFLLTQPYPIIGYVNVEKDGESRCLCRFRINVRRKPKPSNFVYTESYDYISITKVLEECRDFSSAASESANAASDSAIKAQSYTEGGTGTRDGEDADNAKYYYQQASIKANAANTSALNAKASEVLSSTKANEASESVEEAERYMTLSESFARGGTEARPNENVDNSKYYYEQAKRISQGLQGALIPMGTIAFYQLSTVAKQAGYMYNITDWFVTDNTFKEGAGHKCPAGTNVYYTADGYWDCLAGTQVTGVKGEAEEDYRNGDVNITKENIGLGDVPDRIESLEAMVKQLAKEVLYAKPVEFKLLSKPPITGLVGQKITFIASLTLDSSKMTSKEILEENVNDITWVSSNTTIASVTGCSVRTRDNITGSVYVNVLGHKSGNVTVTGTTSNGMSTSCSAVIT